MQFLVAIVLVFLPVLAHSQSPEGQKPATQNVVKADVLYLEEDYVIMKEISGHEVRARVTGATKIEGVAGKLKTGDKVEVTLTPEGDATLIRLQIPDSASPPPR